MTDSLRLLAVFAHPDDESMGMGGTLAKYAAQGVETHLVCASRGERGWPNLVDYPGPSAIGTLREQELENAVQKLGMRGLYFLDYIDGEVDRADPAEAIRKIATHIRRIMPQRLHPPLPSGGLFPPAGWM